MKQVDIINAYKALETLADNKNFKGKEQWLIYKLRKELRPHFEFQKEREQAIADIYIPYADENGTIFGEHLRNYRKDMNELNEMDIDINIDQITLPFVDGLTFRNVEPLEPFIEFEMNE